MFSARTVKTRFVPLAVTLLMGSYVQGVFADAANLPAGSQPALDAIDGASIMGHIQTLSSDEFEGRSVGTHGGDLSVAYLANEFKRLGLAPGNPDGTYVQSVPLTGHRSTPSAHATVGNQQFDLRIPDEMVAWSYERKSDVHVKKSDLVFVGYGVKAPEYQWDDFKGIDLHGKTLLVLINDPQIPDPQHPERLDEHMFKGKAMTYYGRWTYKYEEAAARGAAAVLIIHETATAAYPFEVVINSNSRENFDINTGKPNTHFPPVPAWISHERAAQLLAAAGLNYETLKKAALRRDFHPVALGASIDIDVKKSWRDIESANVVARIEGSDPKLKNETVIYSAHWDHFGWDPTLPGSKHDQIYHGAADNASGVAALLELAKAYRALPTAPKRSIEFIATTAEERGLLGAQYYAEHPLYPLRTTLADINMDGINMLGRTHDIEVVGWGNSDLDDRVVAAAKQQGRVVTADQNAELGTIFRADQLEFMRVGVPSVYLKSGKDFINRPAGYGEAKLASYIKNDYHKVTDVIKPDWTADGAVDDVRLLFLIGYQVSQGDAYPQWHNGVEFKAKRDAMNHSH